MIKLIFWFLFLQLSLTVVAQKNLKKKYLGTYQGEIAAYKINTGDLFVDVGSTKITVKIQKNKLTYSIGRNNMDVDYIWQKLDKKTIQISFVRSSDSTPEVLILSKKSREITRKGIYPQPNAKLKKIKQ